MCEGLTIAVNTRLFPGKPAIWATVTVAEGPEASPLW